MVASEPLTISRWYCGKAGCITGHIHPRRSARPKSQTRLPGRCTGITASAHCLRIAHNNMHAQIGQIWEQTSARKAASCSPMPPLNASASRPPKHAISAPLSRTTRCVNMAMAFLLQDWIRPADRRISADMPIAQQTALLVQQILQALVIPTLFQQVKDDAGPRPVRVPIINPSTAEKPMVVAQLFPHARRTGLRHCPGAPSTRDHGHAAFAPAVCSMMNW